MPGAHAYERLVPPLDQLRRELTRVERERATIKGLIRLAQERERYAEADRYHANLVGVAEVVRS